MNWPNNVNRQYWQQQRRVACTSVCLSVVTAQECTEFMVHWQHVVII